MVNILYDEATGLIVNIIELEDGADWDPPDGQAVTDFVVGAEFGGTYNPADKSVSPAPLPPESRDEKASREYGAINTDAERISFIGRHLGLEV